MNYIASFIHHSHRDAGQLLGQLRKKKAPGARATVLHSCGADASDASVDDMYLRTGGCTDKSLHDPC